MKKSDPNTARYQIRPASAEEAGLFYAMEPEQDAELGCIGHVRIDFGRGGNRFYHTWHPRGPEELNTQEFKEELTEVMDELRESVLKNFASMTGYCRGHGGEISGGWVQNYGYIVETENYRYCLRCNPVPGDHQAYLTCFDKQVQAMNQCQKDASQPVGQIKYLSTSGQVMECIPYYDEEKFIEDITHSNYYGEPMVIEVFKDRNGQTIPLDFVEQLDPPAPVNVVEYSEEPVPIEIHSLAALKRAIKPGTELMATYHSKHPGLVGLVRVVTEVQTNGFYSKVKGQPYHKYSDTNYGRGFRSDYEKASCYQFDGTTIRVLDARKGDGSVLYEMEVYEPRMEMEAQEESEESFTMTMGGM